MPFQKGTKGDKTITKTLIFSKKFCLICSLDLSAPLPRSIILSRQTNLLWTNTTWEVNFQTIITQYVDIILLPMFLHSIHCRDHICLRLSVVIFFSFSFIFFGRFTSSCNAIMASKYVLNDNGNGNDNAKSSIDGITL